MADALLGVVSEKLLSLLQNEFLTMYGIREKTEKLANTLDLIKAVLEDAEEKQITNKAVKVWLQKLKDATYVLDDILDECSIESRRFQGLSSFFNPLNLMFRRKVGSRLKEITRRFHQLAEDKNNYHLREGVRERPTEVPEWRQTISAIDHHQVYGRDADKEKIVEFLLSQERTSDSLSIYAVVGLGGLGKTTLAQLVCKDQRVSNHFQTVWVCISVNFSVEKIMNSIIESITKTKCDVSDLDAMGKKVQELLQSKTYLLVLDDVWNQSQELEFGLSPNKWNMLKSVLSCGSKGSSILVSTRDINVATIMGACQTQRLSGLSDDDCWSLFKQYAFGPHNNERAELVAIGKKIIQKCGGLPLAAQALGGLMRTKVEVKEWHQVLESSLWDLQDEKYILPALRLSYFDLTSTLKQCFAFCALFPKDTRMEKEHLIHLWMANGFISSRGNLEVEDVGNNIWNELYQKSFFQDIEKDDYSGVISFMMHDLVHDLALSIMEHECMILEDVNKIDLSRNTHHIGFHTGYDVKFSFKKEFFKKVESLRTLYQLGRRGTLSVCFAKYCSLRVLRICCFELLSLHSLIHLRYLELDGFVSDIEVLPDSICSFRKLEILKLHNFSGLRCLPRHMSCLKNLRHLIIEDCIKLTHMFPDIGQLRCLRSLSEYIVKSETGHSLTELKNLKLGGKLSISGLGNVRSIDEAREANLLVKTELRGLSLSWNKSGETNSNATYAEQVLEALQPHSNTKMLRIHMYQGLHLPNWVENLNDLVEVDFYLIKCRRIPSLGKLQCLNKLSLSDVDNMQYLDDDECYDGVELKAFPALKKLTLFRLSSLEQLLKVEKGDMFPCLSVLEIFYCPKLVLPCLPSVERLIIHKCDNELLLSSISNCSALTSLHLYRCKDLSSFPEGMLRNLNHLKHLDIYGHDKLKELPNELCHLNALEYLDIRYCDELECLPVQGWEGLRSLRRLNIFGCKGLRSLPEGIRHLTSLQFLRIRCCKGFKCLPDGIGHLTSLQFLSIEKCEGLKCLPEGIRHLTSLDGLRILYCPALIERCNEGTGVDWDKIAHVPNIELE